MKQEILIKYVDTAKKIEELRNTLNERRDAFNKENEDLINDISTFSTLEIEYKDKLKEFAEEEYNLTKEKKLFGGLSIRETKTIEYDEDIALNWAKNHQLCLQLDKKSFEKVAKAQSLDFVKEGIKVTVCFPKEIKLED